MLLGLRRSNMIASPMKTARPRPYSACAITAHEPSVLLRIGRDAFLEMLREDSVVAAKLLWRFLQETATRVKDLSLSYAEAMKGSDEE